MLLRDPAKRLYFYSPFSLTHCSISNRFSHILTALSTFLPSSLPLSVPLSLLSHYRSLESWPGLVLTVLVSIRRLPLGCGPACVWSNGTEICSHFSSRPWRDFLQNVSAPDVEFPLWKPTTICLLSIRHRTYDISFTWLSSGLCVCVCVCVEGTLKMCLGSFDYNRVDFLWLSSSTCMYISVPV